MKKLGLLLLMVFSFSFLGRTSHISGGDITFTSLGNNTYIITLSLFRDCDGITMSTTNSVTIESASCGESFTVSLPVVPNQLTGDNFTDISQLCETELPNSTCNGGTLPGMQLYVYQDTVTLPANCVDWQVSWSTCCRNVTVNVPTSTSDDVFLMATFDNLNYPDNSSPQFTGQPIPYVCNGQSYSMDFFGVTEPDGDSVSYQFIAAMEAGALPLVYGGGYTPGAPMTGITIDPITGIMNVTPNTNGNFIVTVAIIEYDAAGNVMSTVMRDIQLVVLTCNNEPPVNSDPGGGIANFVSPTGTLLDSATIEICEGQNFCFDVVMEDPDVGDTVVLDTNGFSVIMPGWTYSESGISPKTFTICWTPPAGSPSYVGLPLQFTDDNCPITSIPYNLVIDITIFDAVVTGPDQIICNSQGAQLTAAGGNTFTWTALPGGDPIVVGTNFSCNPCSDPIATPSVTTTYVVEGNLPAGCTQTDTVTVTVVPDYTFSLAQTGGVTCLADTIDLTTTLNPFDPGYAYDWSVLPTGGGTFVDNTVQNPSFVPSAPGTYDMVVEITSPLGCVSYDTAQVVVNPGFAPDFDLMTQDDTIDCGDITDIEVNINSSIPAFCAASPLVCGATVNADVGSANVTGSNTGTNWPAPYGNWYRNAKHQFLFTAAELNAMGFMGGKISEISWETTADNNATANFNGYTIWIGCTGTTDLVDWEPVGNLTQVFGPTNITVNLGWNTHQFTQGYDWDGVSNLVVQICYDNLATSYTRNWSTPYTTTTFGSSLYYYSDGIAACPATTQAWSSPDMNRPVTRFGYCAGDPDPSNYTFQFNPNATNVIQPDSVEVDPCTTTTYTVTVTDNTTGCIDSAQITIYVDNPCSDPTLTMDSVVCNGTATGTVYSEANGTYGPWDFEWQDSTGAVIQTTIDATHDTLFNVPDGWYWCYTTDSSGCQKYDSIYVGEPPLLTLAVSNDSTICIGDDVTVEAYAAGGVGGYVYNWNQGLASTDSSHVVTPANDTCYVLTVTDANGCTTAADSVCITLNPPLSAVLSPNDSICPGFSSTITATAAGGSGTGYQYNWIDSDGNVYTGASFTVTPTNLYTEFYLTLTDDCTTPAYLDTVTVVLQPFTENLSLTDASCGGYADGVAVATISGTTGPYQFEWMDDQMNIVETDVNVVATDSVTILSAGNYILQVTDQTGCQTDTSFTIGEPTPVTITMGPNSNICLTDSAQISATAGGGTGPYTLTWTGIAGDGPHNVSPTQDTWYSVFATDANGCTSGTDSVEVTVNPPLTATALVDGTICPGESFNQTVVASGGSGTGYNYAWVGSDGNTYSGDDITVTPNASPVTYYLTVTDNCGTPAHLDTFVVNWSTLPTVDFSGINLSGCYPVEASFTANVPNAAAYNWIFGDGNTTGFGQNMAVTNEYTSPGCFDVTLEVQTNDGCLVDTTFASYVCAWDFPDASFIASPQVTTTEATQVTFTNTSDDNSTNFWNFAGLGQSSVENPIFTFPDEEEGQYPVTLVVTNDYGCTDSTQLIITVEQEVQFFIPNAFTPDGDPYNDSWVITGYGFDPYNFKCTVYNRWGEIVFETQNSEVGWDGRFMGELVPDGVYVWKITTKRLRDDSKVERYGHLTIIR